MTVSADVPGAQSGADEALAIADGLKGIASDFGTACDTAANMFKGKPTVTGMEQFESEYVGFMNEVQVQATDIADNIHASASEIGGTDDTNRSEFAGSHPDFPDISIY
ncbi:hypothetical protein [Nocardiopsis sp. B62]|uniref:hypothetical protein n=1 Tax=Nocardiopsis sp. B62 TaxID=2824874 RepID=UPI001B3695AB|nr:hypothetical protein [Nocardiopsis sp. B62]MBQ1083453.1 hypothetical protein [Nocardiopsis sp. B62]